MAAQRSSPTIVGRDNELHQLEVAWRVALDGDPQLFVVLGEAGIGKTRLAREFAQRVERTDARVLWGDCIDLVEGRLPYAPIRQVVRAITRSTEDRQHIESLRVGLSAVFPDLLASEGLRSLGEQDRRVRLFESLLELLDALARTAPLLLVVDDIQWADQGTLDLLTFLARNLTEVPVFQLLTFRDGNLTSDDPLKGFLIGHGSSTIRRLYLGPLDERSVAAQIAEIVESAPNPQLVDEVLLRSDGNPFFVEELLAAGVEHRDRVPPTIRELLLSRMLHVPAATRRVLGFAAVAGRTVAHETLAEVADVDDDELSQALRAAVDAQVLEPDEHGYAYRHTLLRDALYNDLLPSDRRWMHQAYASALATGHRREPSIMAAVATHYDLGGQPERALPAFVEAAAAAEQSFAFADAERYLNRAVELWDEISDPAQVAGIDKATLLTRAAEAALAVEESKHAVTYAQDAIRLVDSHKEPARAGLLQSLLGRALWTAGDEKATREAWNRAIDTVPVDPPSRERAEVLAYHAAQLASEGRFTDAKALGQEAIQVAQSARAVAEECRPLLTTGSVTARLGDLTHGLKLIDKAEEIARAHNMAIELMRVYLHRGRALQAYAAWENALDNYTRGAAEAPKFGMARRYGWRFHVLAARMLFWLGRWDEARDLLDEARKQWPDVVALPSLLIASGQWDAARAWFAQQPSNWRSDGTGLLQQPEAQVDLATWLRHYDDALDHCAEGLALVGRSEEPLPTARLCVAGLRALADRSQTSDIPPGSVAHASHLHERLQRSANSRQPQPDGWGQELAALAATGSAEFARLDREDATLWERAVQAWSDLSMPYPAAYARFRQAQRLLVAGDRGEAAILLRTSHAVARELGAKPLMTLIEECATRGGLALISSFHDESGTHSDPYDLTPREQQVLDLLLKGHSNRMIAAALYIVEGTASVHVSRILRKMGVSNRSDAIAQVHRDRFDRRAPPNKR